MIFNGCAAVNPPSDELLRRPAGRTLGQIAIVSSELLHPAPWQMSLPVGSHSEGIRPCRYCDSDFTPASRTSRLCSKRCASRYALDRAIEGLEYVREIEIAKHEFAAN
jgi:hypothetical protein